MSPSHCNERNGSAAAWADAHDDTDVSATLASLAYNLRSAWHTPTSSLFRLLAPEVWDATHNTVAVLHAVRHDPAVLAEHATQIIAARCDLEAYLARPARVVAAPRVAYFSAEFAVAESLPIYSGGLGVLAGDHLKAASDLGLPLVGIGLLYRYGYFRQVIDERGYQRETYERLDTTAVPLRPVLAADRVPLEIGVPFPGRQVVARVWVAQVGRVPLYLLDTDLPLNHEEDRWITGHLYGGDQDTRIRQEMVLGIGGARLLRALQILGREMAPEVYHLNEGHSAFVALELARERMQAWSSDGFDEAHAWVASRLAFTTHTPVSAGHDTFPEELVETYLADYRDELGLSHEQLMALGRRDPTAQQEGFSMTVLALRSAHHRNGVSQLHGVVSRQMWGEIGVGLRETPPQTAMEAITNGVHTATWAGPEMAALLDHAVGRSWREAPHDHAAWGQLVNVDPGDLWTARTAQRARLLERVDAAARAEGRDGLAQEATPQRALVVGFARRFATYKRAGLLLEDPDRLARLLGGDPSRPVILVFAGKAHPRDHAGKLLVQRIVQASRDERFRGRIVFLEDYGVELARLLVQGSDLWLNTPRRPEEASGTSGMKAALNGALHLSELDGWWDEAYEPGLGWALAACIRDDLVGEACDAADARQLMDLLEHEVTPLFFARDGEGRPREWLQRVARSIATLAGEFSAQRMVHEYVDRVYRPAAAMRHSTATRLASSPVDVLTSRRARSRAQTGSLESLSVPPELAA